MDITSRIIVAIWGLDGTNGLIGTQRKQESRIQRLEQFREEIRTLWAFVRWLSLGIVALIGFLSTDAMERLIRSMFAAWLR
jgi:hypothetical protein